MEQSEGDYRLSSELWQGSQVMILNSENGWICGIPLEFVQTAGSDSVATCRYLYSVLECCLDNESSSFSLAKRSKDGEVSLVDAFDQIEAGFYVLVSPPYRDLQFSRGPQGKSRFRAFEEDASNSTVSNSSRSSTHQQRFRMELLARDGDCLASGAYGITRLTACHIVPFSLGQSFLDEIMDFGNTGRRTTLYSASNGLLLRSDLHKEYDSYLLSMWHEEGRYYIHTFDETLSQFHGHEVIWRSSVKQADKPNPYLLRWHYKQCVMARFRGFKVAVIPCSS